MASAIPRSAHPPTSPALPARLEPQDLDALVHDASHLEFEVTGAELADQHARGVSIRAGRLTKVDLSGSRLEQLRLVDCELDGCNLANLQGCGAEIVRVRIEASRLTRPRGVWAAALGIERLDED